MNTHFYAVKFYRNGQSIFAFSDFSFLYNFFLARSIYSILQVLENVFPHWHMVFRIGINTFPYSVKEDST